MPTIDNVPQDRDEELREQILTNKRKTGGDPSLLLDLLSELIERESWKKRGEDGWSFLRYVQTPFDDGGLGFDREEVENIIQFRHKYEKDGPRHDPEKAEEMDRLRSKVRGLLTPELGQHGGDRTEEKSSSETIDPNERGSDYLTARIARDHPEVHERMKDGEFSSVRQAAIEAGIIDDIRTKQIRETDGREKMEAKIRHVYGDEVADRLFSGEIQADPKTDTDPPEAPDPEEIDPERAAIYVGNLQSAYRDGERGFQHVPGHIKRIIKEGLWRRVHAEETGETVTFDTFREFVTAPLPEGLGADPSTLVAMCQGDSEALGLLREHGIE